MASPVLFHRWLLREIPQAYVLLVLVAFVVAIFTYFIDWSTVRRESTVQPKNDNNEQRYTGSIIVPTGRDMCWTIMLDNRTGKLRENGYVKCDEAERQFVEKTPPRGAEMMRLRDVSKVFRHNGD